MLQKGAVELMDQPGPRYYSRLFLGGMETRHQPFGTEWIHHSDEVQDGNRRFSPGISPPRRLDVLHRPPGCVPPDPGPLEVSPTSVVLSRGLCLSVQGIVLRPFHCFASLHQCLRSGFGVGTSEGRVPSLLSGRLAGGCRIKGSASLPSRSSPVVHRSGGLWSTGRSRT